MSHCSFCVGVGGNIGLYNFFVGVPLTFLKMGLPKHFSTWQKLEFGSWCLCVEMTFLVLSGHP